MSARGIESVSRRGFLASGGALIVSFSLLPRALGAPESQSTPQPKPEPKLPGSLKSAPMLDSWIRIGANGSITVFTGKVEFGQGVKTALIQIAAEELVVEPGRIELVTADTGRTPNESWTWPSPRAQRATARQSL